MKPIPRSYSRPRVGMPQFTLANVRDECAGSRACGTGQALALALAEITEWAWVKENGEAMTLLIHRIHELGNEAARHFLGAPRHKIVVSKYEAQSLERFRINRDFHKLDLTLGEDPEDTGLRLLAELGCLRRRLTQLFYIKDQPQVLSLSRPIGLFSCILRPPHRECNAY